MAQPMGSYDENLLRDAPVATRQQLQEGYTTDLLASPSKPRSLNRTQSPLPDGAMATTPLRADLEQGQRSQDGFNHYAPLSEKVIPSSKTPFFRTMKGIVLIAVLVIIIVGAVIGAAVGTTVNKNNSQSPSNSNISSQSGSTATVGIAPGGAPVGSSNSSQIFSFPLPTTSTSAGAVVGPGSTSTRTPDGANGYAVLQSESTAIAAMKQAEHYKRRNAFQASGNVDIS